MTHLPQRVAVVAGGSSGIGLATVSSLLDENIKVAFFGQSSEHVESAKEKLSVHARAGNIFAHTVDVTERSQILRFFDELAGLWSMPDILVYSAGISPKGPRGATPFVEVSAEEWQLVQAVNVTGAMLCCQAVLPHMLERGFGRIVLVGSIAGRTIPRIAGAAYVTSKSALSGLTRVLVANTAGRDITVNLVAPGRIATDMAGPPDSDTNRAALARIPVGRLGKPDDVAAAIRFLVSDSAGFINGATLDVNGGEFAPL
ncbi:MAG: SDR family oxidoreductase [Mesorhizobium sp.]|uniref:3-oxoacyl-ACP reductase FabG n=1 Tax=Mesorhizobium sp. TaxID=1871066 RepID=UPI0011FB6910|nr:3-oxoacyl-ACP reductase FabG [Mesorhizobium sp.]TIO47848.1 MAG: SDR family oxidoreductase [Mesorhizobium sp.]TIO56101.1 MAG: SDR family oxidoreductase [Mesorhizobium sp.]TJV57094.1 MAG: SDR family oxidoreductase [Mesorhizobium sp.]